MQKGTKRERRNRRAAEKLRHHRNDGNRPAKGRGPLSIRKNFQRLMLLAKALRVRV